MKPVAVLIIDSSGARLEPIKGSLAQMAEKMADTVGKMPGMRKGKESSEG